MKTEANEGSVERFLQVWRRRKWPALLVFSGIFAPGAAFVLGLPNGYRSTATLLVEPGTSDSLVAGELEARLQTIHLEILSRARLLDLIRRLNLYSELDSRVPEEALVEQMRHDIRTDLKSAENPSGPGQTVSFTLSYRGGDPQTVALVTNTLAAFYLEEDLKMRERRVSGTVQVLKSQLEESKKGLEDRERRLADFQDQNLGELPQQTDLNLAALSRLSEQLRLAIDERMKATERREALSRRLAEAVAAASEPDVMATRIARLKADLQDLRRRFSDKYPDVIRVQEELAAIKRQAEEAKRQPNPDPRAPDGNRALVTLKESVRDAQAEVAVAKAEEDRLRREIAAYSRRLENAPRRQLAFQEVLRDYQTTKELYNSLLKRYEEARLAEGTQQENKLPRFRILDAAVPAHAPAAPNRVQLLAFALILALALAAAAVAAQERLDTSFHTADDLRDFASVPVLASVPQVITRADAWRRGGHALLTATAVVLVLALGVAASHRTAQGKEGLVWMLARGKS